MKKYSEVLRKCPLFNGIEDENIGSLLSCLSANTVTCNKNETIMSEGESAEYIGIVLSGKVQIERTDYYGNRSIVTGIEASQLFGEAFACAGTEKIPIDVIAAEDSEIMLLDCRKIIGSCRIACEYHSQMVLNLLKVVASKNIILNQKLEITSKRTTREKLMTYLQLLAKKCGSNPFTVPFDRQGLADYLEVDRSGLSAEISKLRREGIIECTRNKFKLLK